MQNLENCVRGAQTFSQIRGVWHRPNSSGKETNLTELCQLLDKFRDAGINTVFLETFFHGMTVFRTDSVPYYKGFEEFSYGEYPDYLTAFATEADKRGIRVQAWVQDFYIGYEEDAELVKAHTDWILINQQGGVRHMTEGHGFGGYIFLDPANPEAKSFLKNLYDELLTKIPVITGLNLDYIRYPISEFEEDTDTGYTEICMSEFAIKQGLLLDEKNPREDLHRQIKEKELLPQWTAHRAYHITAFVRDICEMLQEKHPGKLISTAVFPELDVSYNKKKQTISVWLEKGYIDMVTPMVYFYEAPKVFEAVQKIKSMCYSAYCYTGLYTTYHGQSVNDLSEHIAASECAGAEGFVLFDSAKTFFEAKEDYMTFLKERYGNKN